jgi:hypothetical protein
VLAVQESALVAGVVQRLTEMAFNQCVAKPSSSLSSSEQSCIQVGAGDTLVCFRAVCVLLSCVLV